MFANGADGGGGQDQVPQPTQLDEENSHATKNVASNFHGSFTSSCFVGNFGAAFQLRRENVNGGLVQIILHVLHKTNDPNVVAPEFFEMPLCFIMDGTKQPELGPLQIKPVPCFEQVMNPLTLD